MKAAPNRADISWRRARSDIADGFQSGAAQAAGDRIVGAEREHRQRPRPLPASSPSATILPETQRVSVRAQTEVPAIAALTVKPCRVSAPQRAQQRAPRRRTDGRSR